MNPDLSTRLKSYSINPLICRLCRGSDCSSRGWQNLPERQSLHTGYYPVYITSDSNDSSIGTPKLGIGSVWYISSDILVFADGYWLKGGPETFIRGIYKLLGGEAGLFANIGSRELTGKSDNKEILFKDVYYKFGADFAVFPISIVEISGLFYFAINLNPDGSQKSSIYKSGYLEAEVFPLPEFASAVRYEILSTDKLSHYLVLEPRYYFRENVGFTLDYRFNFQKLERSSFFIGTHFAF